MNETDLSSVEVSDARPTMAARLRKALLVIGPGAIIASLTIGTGELIFSARAGVLFGYNILWVFALLLIFKGVMVYTLSRQLVLTGVHPLVRWMELPGPRGWFPMSLFLVAFLLFPVWVGFHSGVIGTLLAQVTGGSPVVFSFVTLGATFLLVWLGGYATLERVQLAVVGAMVLGVLVSVLLLQPDLWEVIRGLFLPSWLELPRWVEEDARYASIAERPVWAELGTYVGVIGGSSFDYLAYTVYLREKGWGRSDPNRPNVDSDRARHDLRMVRADLLVSFGAVLVISMAFVISGHMVLAPAHQIPNDSNMLNLQATFLTRLHPWLYPLYVIGALLTMLGTLYGTIEVAPAVFAEGQRAYRGKVSSVSRYQAVTWVGIGGAIIIVVRLWSETLADSASRWSLIDLVTPAAIVTGVLTCGFICWANIWTERRFLLPGERASPFLLALNGVGGVLFLAVGARSLWEAKSVSAYPWLPLALIFGTGALVAWCVPPRQARKNEETSIKDL